MGPPLLLVGSFLATLISQSLAARCVEIKQNSLFERHQELKEVRPCNHYSDGIGEGCEVVIRCFQDYYYRDPKYGDGQRLTCQGGAWTTDGKTASIAACDMGCKVLRDTELLGMRNATFIVGPPKEEYRNGDDYYWPRGTHIETKCKDGYDFDEAKNRKNGKDSHTCLGGNDFWRDDTVNDYTGSRPGLCLPSCDQITNIPPSVEVVLKPTEEYITDNGKVLVKTIYRFACKSGESLDCRKNQTLVCYGGVEGYYDPYTAKTRQTVFTCASKTCPPYQNNDKNSVVFAGKKDCPRNLDGEVPEDCEVQIKCKDDYYYTSPSDSDGRTLVCKDGEWIDKNTGKKPTDENECKKGCKVLREDDPQGLKNATFIGKGKPSQTYMNGKDEYWPAGTIVETKCKEGYAFEMPDDRKRGQDKYECAGGDDYWKDSHKDKYTGSRPGWCPPLCEAFSKNTLPPGVKITTDPADSDLTEKINDKVYTYSQAQYKFKCDEGYKYPSGGPEQTLICWGGDLKYYDPDTKQFKAGVKECVSDGCPVISAANIDKNAAITSSNDKCKSNGETAPEGCEIHIQCKAKTHYFDSPNYPEGQKLVCKKGKWTDQNGKVIEPRKGLLSDRCIGGCAALTDADMPYATFVGSKPKGDFEVHKNGKDEVWAAKTVIATKCKPGYGRPDPEDQKQEPNRYICDEGGWTNLATNEPNQQPGRCDPLCKLHTLQEGTKFASKIADSSKTEVDGETYVYPSTVVKVQCEANYKPPEDVKYPDDTQALECKGGDNGFYDPTTKKNNAVPIVCKKVGANGCSPITPQTVGVGANVTSDKCDIKDGLVPAGCKVTIKCNDGYYPSGTNGKTPESQSLVCKAGVSGWVDSNTNTENATHIICLPGCDAVDDLGRATLVGGKPETVTVGNKQYYKADTQIKIKCKDDFVPKTGPEREAGTIPYKCKGGNKDKQWLNEITRKPESKPGDTCSKVCEAVLQPPTGVSAIQSPGFFEHKGKSVVVEGDQYGFRCVNGYKYPASSSPATKGKQYLLCIGEPDGYLDTDTNKTTKEPQSCERGSPAGCIKLDVENPPTNTIVSSSSGCKLQNGLTAPGCHVTLECAKEHYPKTPEYRKDGKQDLECTDDGKTSQWTDQTKKVVVNFLECQEGCGVVDPLKNAIYTHQPAPSIKSGGQNMYAVGTIVTIKCKPGTVPAEGDVDDAEKPTDYECKGGQKGWLNKNTNKNEERPGDNCLTVCDALTPLPEGVRATQQAAEFMYRDKMVVREKSRYVFKCAEGYHYPKNTPQAKNKKQSAVCDGKNGQYIDPESGNNDTFTRPLACEREIGEGCIDLAQENGKITSEKCPSGVKSRGNGCNITVECKENFYPEAPNYQKSGKQELTCKDGKDWVDQFGRIVNTKLYCLPGCVVTPEDKKTVKITTDSGETVKIDNYVIYKPGAIIKVTCIGDGVVWKNDITETKNPHTYECKGGDNKWERQDDKKTTVNVGDGCVNTCKVESLKVPDTVKQVQTAQSFEHEGKTLIVAGSSYIMKCKPDYTYPKESPYARPGKQTLQCDGEKRALEDKENPANKDGKIEECTPEKGANLCKDIPQNTETSQVHVQNCEKKGDYYPTGCKVEVACKPGHYPKDPEYQQIPGTQTLTCQSAGRGWADQLYRPVTKPLECVKGCVPSTFNSATNTDKKTIITNYVIGKEQVSCTVEETTITKNSSSVNTENAFYCPRNNTDGTTNDIVDKSCTNACATVRSPFPEGVKLQRLVGHKLDVGKKSFVHNNAQYIFQCATGYQYPKNSKHRPQGNQILRCNGKTNEYDDPTTGVSNTPIEPCEKVKGCEEIKQNPQQTQTNVVSCTKDGSTFASGCKLKVHCKPGSYPKDPKYLRDAAQELICSDNGPGWVDQNKNKVDKPMECVDGCIDGSDKAVIISHTLDRNITEDRDYMYINDMNGVTIAECLTVDTIKREIERILKRQADDHKFYCKLQDKIEKDKIDFYYDDFCKDACHELMKPLPANVKINKSPRIFPHGDRNYVPNNDAYELTCADGFQYPSATPAADKGKQTLVCNGGSHRYDDPDSGIKNAKPIGCVPITGCKPPPKEDEGTVVSKNKCSLKGAVYEYGCEITTYCKDGYYPANKKLWGSGGQDLSCKIGTGDKFVNENGVPVESFMKCIKGCVNSTGTTETIIDENREFTTVMNYEGKILAKCASMETIKREIEKRKKQHNKFFCQNNGTNNENGTSYYDDYCNNACRTLQEPLPFGVVIQKKPPIFPHAGNTYTIHNGIYQLACNSGYSYPKDSPYAANNLQTLKCDGESHKFIDEKTGKANPVIPSCVKLEGCKSLGRETEGSKQSRHNCQNQGKDVNKGCAITITCDTGYYPAIDKYLKPKKQVLTCVEDGSGWADQDGTLVSAPMTCNKGCIQRPTKAPSSSSDSESLEMTYNLPGGLIVFCSYKSVTLNTKVEFGGEEHDYYCRNSNGGSDGSSSDTKRTVSPCSNACKALTTPSGATETSDKPRPPLVFDKVNYVKDGHKYIFTCSNKNTIELTCDGSTGKYNEKSGKSGLTEAPSC